MAQWTKTYSLLDKNLYPLDNNKGTIYTYSKMKEEEKQFIAKEDGKTYIEDPRKKHLDFIMNQIIENKRLSSYPPFNMDIVMEKSKSYQETMDKWREILIVRGFNEETIYTLTNEEIENIVDERDFDRYRIDEKRKEKKRNKI